MSYTTNPIANRLGIQLGWHNSLLPLNPGLTNIGFIAYLKNYLFIKEYLLYHQIDVLFFEIKPLANNHKLLHILIYKSLPIITEKTSMPVFSDKRLMEHTAVNSQVVQASNQFVTSSQMEMDVLYKYRKLHVKKRNKIRRQVILKTYSSGLKYYTRNKKKQKNLRKLQRIFIQRLKFKVQKKKRHQEPWYITKFKYKRRKHRCYSELSHKWQRYNFLRKNCSVNGQVLTQKIIRNSVRKKKKLRWQRNKWFKLFVYKLWHRKKTFPLTRHKRLKLRRKLFVVKWHSFGIINDYYRSFAKSKAKNRFRLDYLVSSFLRQVYRYRHRNSKLLRKRRRSFRMKVLRSVRKHNKWKNMNRTKLFNFVRKCNIAFRHYAINSRLEKKKRCTMRYMTYAKMFIKHKKLNHVMTTVFPKQLRYGKNTNKNVHSNFSPNLIQPAFIIFKIQMFFEKYFGSRFTFFPSVKIKNLAMLIDVNNLCKLKKYQQHFIMNRFAQKDFFHRVLFAFLTTKRQMSPQVVADIIASEMARHEKKHMSLLYSINDMFGVLHSEHIKGYKILIDGKINGRNKTTKQIFRLYNRAKIPFQDFSNRISYALGVSRTYTGLFGIRVWLYY